MPLTAQTPDLMKTFSRSPFFKEMHSLSTNGDLRKVQQRKCHTIVGKERNTPEPSRDIVCGPVYLRLTLS